MRLHELDPEQDVRTTRATPMESVDVSRVASRPESRPDSPPRTSDERRKNRFQLAPERVSALLVAEHENARSRSASPGLIRGNGSRRDLRSLMDAPDEMNDFEYGDDVENADGMRHVLRHDIAFVMRRRAEEGYSLDNLLLNAAIATRFSGAERIAGTWEFVDHFVRATAPDVSIHSGYDMTYQGLWPVWTGQLGRESRDGAWAPPRPSNGSSSRHVSGSGKTPLEVLDAHYNVAIAHINAMRADVSAVAAPGNHRLPHSDRAPLRRMMLAVCGENHMYDTMEEVTR